MSWSRSFGQISTLFSWLAAYPRSWYYYGMLVPIVLATGLGLLVWRAVKNNRPLLDAHLPKDTENAVVYAASHETNPSKLRAFGHSLLKDFPAAASVLFARAVKVEQDVATGCGASL